MPLANLCRPDQKARRALLPRNEKGQKSRRKPGRKPALGLAEVRLAIALRRNGASVKTILAKLEERLGKRVWRSTLSRCFSRFRVLGQKRSPVLALLEAAPLGAPRLDLARRILDLDELARLPRAERTVSFFERIRATRWQRNQFARIVEWCASLGVQLLKDDDGGDEDPLLVLDVRALRRVLTPQVIEAATKVRLQAEDRRKP